MRRVQDPASSARRLLWRAGLLALPMAALALAAPRVVRLLRPDAARKADLLARLEAEGAGGRARPAEESPPPRPPDGPTREQIEAGRRAQVALGEAQAGWERVTVIAPREARRGPDGLEALPFHGFGVQVDSAPEGAQVLVGGESLGETPLVASLKCAPGSEVAVRVVKAPLPAFERTVRCRADTLVRLTVRLDGR